MSAQLQPAPPVLAPDSAAVNWWQLMRYWGVAIAWMAVISTLSSDAFSASNTNHYLDPLLRWLFPDIPVERLFVLHTVVRKSAHLTEFFILGLLLFWASRRGRPPRWRLAWVVQALLIASVYALLDEFHQAFEPHRTASLADSGIDIVGAAASQIVIYLRSLWVGARAGA